ncbi:aldehyde dehydrogenase family protein [Aliamphritea hakodatensis]|uniref:aldehyde dehydrogenase family protein n=1 Tax=Aliamphritea hakodatensis TaxID=2895352 RepID=UPI0022FD67AC|nr:aldehyde dehydrogenase family protein [Aliamphritea hakodatensis]
MQQLPAQWHNYINGRWHTGQSGNLSVENPADLSKVADISLAGPADVEAAVTAARDCHNSGVLPAMRPVERGRLVRKMGDYLLANCSEIARVLTLETGKPLAESAGEIQGAARYFEYYANQAETVDGRSIPLGNDYIDYTVYEPFGVTAHIVPWNFPVEMIARSVAPALVTGNTCVIKTPELTPLACTYIAKAAEFAGLPEGAVNILCGYGHEAGAALSNHPDIDQIVFTGSVQTGTLIAEAAARNLVPCVLELGGKSAAIVCEDADLDTVVESVRWGIFYNAGQVCSALSRIIVHRDIHDELLQRLTQLAESIRIGSHDETPDMGTLVSMDQQRRVGEFCQQAIQAGAIATTGGTAPDRPGAFFLPTVFSQVTADMAIATEEVFGPVLTVQAFADDAEAIQLANGTEYSLAGGVFSNDLQRVMRLSQQLKAGQVYINEWYAGGVETPFGGTGKSGYGREKGREGLLNYVHSKNVAIRLK